MAAKPHTRNAWIGVALVAVAGVAVGGWLVALSRPAIITVGNDPVRQKVMSLEPMTLTTTASLSATIGYQPAPVKAVAGVAGVVTWLPSAGSVIEQGGALFSVDGEPTILLYGSVPEWRTLSMGVSPSADVQELQQNLNQMGYAGAYPLPKDGTYSAATGYAVQRLLKAKGLPASTQLTYGTVLYAPGPVFVSGLATGLGATVSSGTAVLTITSTQRLVTGSFSSSGLAVGQRAIITPATGGPALTGTVGGLTTQNSNGSSQEDVSITLSGSPALPTGEIAAQVTVVMQSIKDVLAVPVQALVALVEGGYALEVPTKHGGDHLVAVHVGVTGGNNLVQVSGPAIGPGLRVLVPTLY